MNFYGSRTMRRTLGAFSAFAGGGRNIFGDFAFAESWSSDDFESSSQFNNWVKPYLDQVGRKDLTWEPPSTTTRTRASKAWSLWKAAQEAGSAQADAYVNDIKSQMGVLVARADSLSLAASLGHRSEDVEVQRYDTFNEIKRIVTKVANSSTQAQSALDAANTAPPVLPSAGTPSQSGSQLPTQHASADTAVTAGDYGVRSGGSNTLLYAGLGVGALVLVGAVLMMRKRSSVAGYRRRRRSRR